MAAVWMQRGKTFMDRRIRNPIQPNSNTSPTWARASGRHGDRRLGKRTLRAIGDKGVSFSLRPALRLQQDAKENGLCVGPQQSKQYDLVDVSASADSRTLRIWQRLREAILRHAVGAILNRIPSHTMVSMTHPSDTLARRDDDLYRYRKFSGGDGIDYPQSAEFF